MTRTPLAFVLLLLVAGPVFAQRVVILEFEADKANRLRTQVEKALRKANAVKLVPIAKWKRLAGKQKIKGLQAMTPAAVGKLAALAEVDAAVEGAIGAKFFVRILDHAGQELWSRELPLKKGLLSSGLSKRLAKAIIVAAKTAPLATKEETPKEEEVQNEPPSPEPNPEKSEPVLLADPPLKSVDADQPPLPVEPANEEPAKPQKEAGEAAQPQAVIERGKPINPEPIPDLAKQEKKPAGFNIVRIWVAGTTTWRSYCSRPGVRTCKEYDNRDLKPSGDTVDFSPVAPYAGFSLQLELFPIAIFSDNKFASGLTFAFDFALGFALTKVRVTSPSGETPEKDVVSADRGWSVQVGYRFPFVFGSDSDRLIAYLGPRVGLASRVFAIDPRAQVPLPGSYRLFPQVGIDGALPLGSKYARLEAGFTYFFNPKPGPDEIVGYGNLEDPSGGGKGSGFGFEAGLGGEIWGPLGYTIKVRYSRFTDQFLGEGKKWTRCDSTQCGGAAEEVYGALVWGLTASF